MTYLSLKPCPVCGEHPELHKVDLGRPGGRGYPGHFAYQYKCGLCKLLKGTETQDIYYSSETSKNHAKEFWNEEVDRVQVLMLRRHKENTGFHF